MAFVDGLPPDSPWPLTCLAKALKKKAEPAREWQLPKDALGWHKLWLSWALFGLSWALFELSWALLGPSWAVLSHLDLSLSWDYAGKKSILGRF